MILNHKGKHRFAFANLRKLMNLLVAAAAMKSKRVGFLKGFERINSICRNYPIFLQKKKKGGTSRTHIARILAIF